MARLTHVFRYAALSLYNDCPRSIESMIEGQEIISGVWSHEAV